MALQKNKAGPARFEYDVFLSFRGEDTRYNFMGFFHYMLEEQGIHAYFDEEDDLPKGQRIEEILEAIRKSRILVPIFSQGYAESKWCLREVAKMVECDDGGQQRLIIPIFFDIDPTDVRHQTGPFKAAFKKHHQKEKRDEVDGWRRALRHIGGISGYHLKDQYKGNQPQLVDSIIEEIQKVLTTKRLLHEEEYLVGVDVRVDEIINRLDFEAKGARIIGIHGIGGIGKTTLAKAIYNRNRHRFQASCFIENVREVSKSSKGLVQLQQQLVQDISKDKHKKEIHNSSQGAKMIEDMIRGKSVLLVLDDVDDQKQLDALGGNISRFHFHSGSRVIITTRQKKILEGLQDEAVYSVEELEEKEAVQLFNHHAFGADGPQEEYMNLIEEVVSISKRVPLALQVLGAHFKRARTPEQWKKWVKNFRRRQHEDIHENLRICYDSLNDEEKLIFLDIACHFVANSSEDAICMWEELKLSPHQALQSLQDKSLIKINKEKEFEMHDLIRDMGREVVMRESSRHPENRSWLLDTRDRMEASTTSQRNKSGTSRLLSSMNHGCFDYDVFLSFHGKDTRKNFTEFFHYILELEGIHAFFDEEDLPKGERIEEILEAIRKSKILVPIFSKDYAGSKWCLKEVAKMVECDDGGQQRRIIPIFFDVDPRDVRHQTGPFEAAFKDHHQKEKRDEVDGWRRALEHVGGISGYHLQDQYKGNQLKLVTSFIDGIQKDLTTKRLLDEKEYLVGVDVRVYEITKRLDFKAKGTRIIGIHGIGGIGKTTLAKAIYDQSRHLFEASCFIENVRGASKSFKELVQLQQQLVRDISEDRKKTIDDLNQGVQMINDLVSRKSVLVVLDDVDDQAQLNKLAGSISQFDFHSGSRVIVTTRQKKILEELHDEAVYSLEELEDKEALQLFNHHAFGADRPPERYTNLIKEAVSISKRVPLALQVFGKLFKTRRTKEWEGLVEELRRQQNKDIHKILRICYDSLNNAEKLIFLDIACLLVGKNSEDAIYVWEDLDLRPHQRLRSLQDRSLIKINKGKFEMHDQIRDMGREIVLSENLLPPASLSRLWRNGDVEKASTMSQGNEIQEILHNLREGREMELSTQAFGSMAQLRVLLINVSISNDCAFMHFPASLRWLEWEWCPFGELPLESKFKGIVVLSFISQLWRETTAESSSMPTKEMFKSLKVLDLSCCKRLNATSNFAITPNLEKLILDECSSLKKVDDSIAALKKLVFFSMKGCVSLEKLPSEIYELSSLKVFNLEGCSKLVAFPEFPPTISTNGLSKLQELILRGCECLESVPPIHKFQSLRSLDIDNHTRDLILEDDGAVKELDELSMSASRNKDEEFCFMLPYGSVNDPLLLKQLLCHSHDDPINKGTMILRVRYEDTANGDWVDTILEAHCDDSFGDDSFGNKKIYAYTVQLPWDDKVSEASRHTSIKMKVRTASNHVLTKVDVKLQKRSEFSPENMKPFISISRKGQSARPKFSIFINLREEYKPDVIEYSRELDDRIDKLRRLNVQVSEQMPLFGWTIEELVILSLIFSDAEVSWYEQRPGTALPRQAREKVFDEMEVLNLSRCKFLVKTPDFARTPQLKRLILDHCECLEEIGESIGQLKKLSLLSIVGCTMLRTLAFASMTDVSSNKLGDLILDDCTSLRELPECIGRFKNLIRLSLRGCHFLEQLSDSIECLVDLKELMLDDCPYLARLPDSIGKLKKLTKMQATRCPFLISMPNLVNLTALEELNVEGCTNLIGIPGLQHLRSLKVLNMNQCWRFDIDSVWSQLEGAAFPHLEAFSISKQVDVAVDTMQIPFPPLHLGKVVLKGKIGRADVVEIKVGEESVGYLQRLEVEFTEDDEINRRLRVLATPTRDDASPRFITFTVCSPRGNCTLRAVDIWFRQSLMSGPGPGPDQGGQANTRSRWAGKHEIKVGEESVGSFEESHVTFTEDDEIKKRPRVLTTATRDAASPPFRTLTICSPPGTRMLLGAETWFGKSLMSGPGPGPDEGGQANTRSKSEKRVWALFKSRMSRLRRMMECWPLQQEMMPVLDSER